MELIEGYKIRLEQLENGARELYEGEKELIRIIIKKIN